ncbi:hypothetical protein FRB99_006792 [Tulasnella sp. 403]|nr:hypothetical protein FRB99_006792 [Tulasnella sp. 403]
MPVDDSKVISASYDNTIRMWRPSLERDKGRIVKKTKQHTSCLAISPVANVVAISLYNSQKELLDMNSGNTLAVLNQPQQVWTLRFSPDGQRLYGGCRDGSVCWWDVDNVLQDGGSARGEQTITHGEIKVTQETVSCVSVSDSWLVSISDDGDVRAAKLKSGAISPASIGKIGRVYDTNRADLSPVSEDGVGFAVSCPTGSRSMNVYRYKSWDTPGVYKD